MDGKQELTQAEVARRLQVGIRKVKQLARRTGHPLPIIKLGHRTYRISVESLEQWLREEAERVMTEREQEII